LPDTAGGCRRHGREQATRHAKIAAVAASHTLISHRRTLQPPHASVSAFSIAAPDIAFPFTPCYDQAVKHSQKGAATIAVKRIQQLWRYLWTSLWFLPAVLVLAAVLLAILLVDLDSRLDAKIWSAWPRLFGAGAAGSRGMLEVIATSMITVAGVVFSITIAALVQASNQYSPRLLRNFMSDRTNQTVLGVFVSIFIYCLVVLRTIRGGDEGAFVPSLAVLGGIGLAFVGIGFLIYFIHHIASSVQASQIVANVTDETLSAIDYLFPAALGEDRTRHDSTQDALQNTLQDRLAAAAGLPIAAQRTGYIQSVDITALLAFAREHQVVVRMEYGIGDFVVAGIRLVTLLPSRNSGAEEPASSIDAACAGTTLTQQLMRAYVVGRQRTITQDAAFGIRQIVDVANKALSPGINDTTTAVLCLEHLTAILVELSGRGIPTPYRYEGSELRVIAIGPAFADLLALSLDEIRRNAAGNVTVLTRLAATLALLADVTHQPARRAALLQQVDALHEVAGRTVSAPPERSALTRQCLALRDVLSARSDDYVV
jgi:uncharacterized membrane protein